MPSKIIPTLKYADAPAAIAFLCEAFGFARHLVVPGEEGLVLHAQLVLGDAMIMLGSARDSEFDAWQQPPAQVGGVGTQSAYVVVEDVDAHCERAKRAGAEVLMPPADQEHGGRLYVCRDPEGHVWSFGSYDPWA